MNGGWSARAKSSGVNVNGSIIRTDQANDNNSLRNADMSQSWFQSENSTSPLPPYSDATLNLLFPNDVTSNGVLPWSQSPGSLADLFPMPMSDDTSMSLNPFSNSLKSWMEVPHYDGEYSDKTMSTFASQSPISTSSSEQDHLSELRRILYQDPDLMSHFVEIYFDKIHPSWSILHAPTFNTQDASPILLGSMLILAYWLEGDMKHEKLASVVFDAILAVRLVICTSFHGKY